MWGFSGAEKACLADDLNYLRPMIFVVLPDRVSARLIRHIRHVTYVSDTEAEYLGGQTRTEVRHAGDRLYI